MPNRIPRPLLLLAILTASLASPAIAADELAPGATVPAIAAKDQHEKDFTLADDTSWLLVSFDMSTGKATNGYLEKKGAAFLIDHNAVFVSNIYGMPGIGRVFALPKMRRYPHRIILADEEHLLDPFPREDGKVTVIKLAPGRVVESITFWSPKESASPLE